ncbi:MAG: acetyl-CoA carboxylase biotin carboxyl carrier protein subunit [candidate division WOR-3 bacterium]|nr:acetyl-CoA carboxylase biotin carboxyl carrier protein subunit [candidate division WOR-3 bacterium]MCX7948082.1 acetyl-CoA carboxylase biotin carboxyl carrier protein subunit [candidate division WOR-3 bacterium]MDW8150980.1 acetyl-CoA carboxylase biotin carboxyl carrier protein subunit [candidate division WOR-3 bacterium]
MKLRDNYGNIYEVSPNPNLKLDVLYRKVGNKIVLFYNSRIYIIEKIDEEIESNIEHRDEILSPITGKISSIKVKEGDEVKSGDVLLSIESMKMEMLITAPKDATIEKIHVKQGEVVGQGKLLLKLKFKI